MDFAKKQLQKYGWTEGKGLGKKEDGIQEALKPRPKHGACGVGFDIAEEFTNHWWQKLYNNAASNIEVNKRDNGEIDSFSTINNERLNIEKRKFKKSKKNKVLRTITEKKKEAYTSSFIKKATLSNGVILPKNEMEKTCSDDDDDKDQIKSEVLPKITDEQLYLACGGRTAHKGARHGLKSNGKLARINEQEEKLLEQMKLKRDEMKRKSKNYSEMNDASCKSIDKSNEGRNMLVGKKEKKSKKRKVDCNGVTL